MLEPLADETVAINEGCLSVPDLRGYLRRHVTVRVRYLDRDGTEHDEIFSAGSPPARSSTRSTTSTGSCSSTGPTRAPSRPGSSSSDASSDEFVERITEFVARVGS